MFFILEKTVLYLFPNFSNNKIALSWQYSQMQGKGDYSSNWTKAHTVAIMPQVPSFICLPSPGRSKIHKGRETLQSFLIPHFLNILIFAYFYLQIFFIPEDTHIYEYICYMYICTHFLCISISKPMLSHGSRFSQEINFNWFNSSSNSGNQGYQTAKFTWLQLAC